MCEVTVKAVEKLTLELENRRLTRWLLKKDVGWMLRELARQKRMTTRPIGLYTHRYNSSNTRRYALIWEDKELCDESQG